MDQNKPIKVLQVACGFRKGVSGGVPSFVHSYTTTMDASDISFDYLSLGYQCFEPYRESLEAMGGELFALGIAGSGAKRARAIIKKLSVFLRENRYDIVHVSTGSVPQLYYAVVAAKKAGVKAVIAHAHNAKPVFGVRRLLYSRYARRIGKLSDALYAVSRAAAENMFSAADSKKGNWILVPDAIHVSNFSFKEDVRAQYRKDLRLEGKFVIGHVGRFNKQKNHTFILEIFSEVCKMRDDAVLMLVGAGDMRDMIEERVSNLGLADRVLFMGQRTDANNLMQAMDVFVFPSLFEGLGIVSIEAQAAGLPVIMSDTVPEETNITELARYLPLSSGAEAWAQLMMQYVGMPRKETTRQIIDAGYNVASAASTLAELYRKLV